MRKPSPATLIATVALFVALGGVGIAADGQNLILGKPDNSATHKTGLSTPVNDKALQLTNTNTGTSATALGLTVASGHAPFTVNSQTRVANLNADKLDGIDSAGFVKGRGTALANRIVFDPTDTKTLMQFPGLGELRATCGASDSEIVWWNTSADTVDLWISPANFDGEFNPGLAVEVTLISSNLRLPIATLMLGVGNGANQRRIASINVAIHQTTAGATCDAEAQGTIWAS
jgi:hypothetical protein